MATVRRGRTSKEKNISSLESRKSRKTPFAPLLSILALIFALTFLLSVAYRRWLHVRGPAAPPETPLDASTLPGPAEPLIWIPLDAATVSNASILSADDFLSVTEVAHVLRLVDSCGGWVPSVTGGTHYEVPHLDAFETAARADPIVRRIEERIAEHTGLPLHPHEDIVSLARITSEGSTPRGGHFPPFGLHHDTDTRPARMWTIIVYLQLPLEGGYTIFPLRRTNGSYQLGTKKNAALMSRHKAFKSELMQHFGGAESGYSRQVSFDRHMQHPFLDMMEEACRGEYGVHFMPTRAGGALMFESAKREGRVPNRLNWHAGCNVLDGTKVILQKFKEQPWEVRRDKDWHVEYKAFVKPLSQ